MTTPTQARIEAALRRARVILANMAQENEGAFFNRWPVNHEPLRADARALVPEIDAALTAAARVGETPMEHIARDIREGRFPQKSEAQVGDDEEKYKRQFKDGWDCGVASTIERCAQVAEQCPTEWATRQDRAAIAAAIRELKAEP